MRLSACLLAVLSLLVLMVAGCADKPQEEATPAPGALAPGATAPADPNGSAPGTQEGELKRFKRP